MNNKTTETKIINGFFSITDILNCYEDTTLKNWTHNPPTSNFCDLILILDGDAIFYAGNKKYNIKKGDIFFRNTNSEFHSEGKIGFHYFTLRFNVGNYDKMSFFKKIYHPDNTGHYFNLFSNAIKLYNQKSYMYNIQIATIIYNIITALVTSDISKNNSHIKHKKIEKSVIYLNKNISNPYLSIDNIAKQSNISVKHFRNIFKEIYKITPIKYITEKRLEKSKELLFYSEYSINEIAEFSGFNSTIYFDRVFKKTYGMTPIEYKEKFSGNQ